MALNPALEHFCRTSLHYYRLWRREAFNRPAPDADLPTPAISKSSPLLQIPPLSPALVEHWDKYGFIVLPQFFSVSEIDYIDKIVDKYWDESRKGSSPLTADIFLGKNERRVKLHDAPIEAKNQPYKLNDLYLESDEVREIILEEKLAGILAHLLNGHPLVCNTLNFEFGSEQEFHTDSLYMTPPKDLNLVATWIALEDCHPDAGPLQYYPGSHKISPFRFSNGNMNAITDEMPNYSKYMNNQVARLGLSKERFCAKKGDVFIWHSQLFHGGSQIIDKQRTRRSLVTHYFRLGDLDCHSMAQNAIGHYMIRDHQAASTKQNEDNISAN